MSGMTARAMGEGGCMRQLAEITVMADYQMSEINDEMKKLQLEGQEEAPDRSNEIIQLMKNELDRAFKREKDAMERSLETHRREGQRLHKNIHSTKSELSRLQQTLIAVQRKVMDLEDRMGS